MPKVLQLTWGKFWCLSACKKSTSSLTCFLNYCKDIADLLFWELWECLAIPIKNHIINLQETFVRICMLQINFITHFFLRYCKETAILLFWVHWACFAAPKMVVSTWRNLWYLCYRQKTNFILSIFLETLQRYCKFIILDTLSKPTYRHPEWY